VRRSHYSEQSTATSRAWQISRIRVSASRPRRATKTATETLSTESRFTAERRGIGSESGSRTTSLASLRIVVVHGATRARRSRGIAASRESTTTGRRPISANSHHHSSPRAGRALTRSRPPAATMPGRPTRPVRQVGARHTRRNLRPLRRIDDERAVLEEPHRRGRHPLFPTVCCAPRRGAWRPRWCSNVCGSCHDYATQREM
jgi:hypothetical protein